MGVSNRNIMDGAAELVERRMGREKEPFTVEDAQIVHDIAKKAVRSVFYQFVTQKKKDRMDGYMDGLTETDVYLDMLSKIVCAPTVLHMEATVVCLMPVLDEKINGQGGKKHV